MNHLRYLTTYKHCKAMLFCHKLFFATLLICKFISEVYCVCEAFNVWLKSCLAHSHVHIPGVVCQNSHAIFPSLQFGESECAQEGETGEKVVYTCLYLINQFSTFLAAFVLYFVKFKCLVEPMTKVCLHLFPK